MKRYLFIILFLFLYAVTPSQSQVGKFVVKNWEEDKWEDVKAVEALFVEGVTAYYIKRGCVRKEIFGLPTSLVVAYSKSIFQETYNGFSWHRNRGASSKNVILGIVVSTASYKFRQLSTRAKVYTTFAVATLIWKYSD